MSEASSETTGGIAESDNADSAQETAEEEASAEDVAGDSMDSEPLRPDAEDPPSSPKTAESPPESPFYEYQSSVDDIDSSNATDDASLTEDSSAVRIDAKKLICVRKDLFPKVRLPKLVPVIPDAYSIRDDITAVSCVKLDTDFEQSIDDVSGKKSMRSSNGIIETMSERQIRPRKHRSDGESIQDTNSNVLEDYKQNGCLPPETKRRRSGFKHKKRSLSSSRRKSSKSAVPHHAKGGKNMNTLQSNLVLDMDDDSSESFDSVDNMALLPRQPNSGKPLSHHMSQLAALEESKRIALVRSLPIVPSGGKPRSMMGITSSSNKKKSNKKNSTATYQSQISVDTNTIKIRIKKSSSHSQMETKSIADVGLRRWTTKRKKVLKSPSSSSGEEYDPSRGDVPVVFSAAATRPRPVRKAALQTRKGLDFHEASVSPEPRPRDRQHSSHSSYKGLWGRGLSPEVLSKIFQYVVSEQGALPTLISLGTVCRLWRVATLTPNLWRYVDLASYTREIWKTDYKLAWLLENRLSLCMQLNLSNWKVTNQTWICACIVEYSPLLRELNLTGWKRLSAENLKDIVDGLQHLERIDLSFTSDAGSSGSCLSPASMAYFAQTIGARLTHLTLANNKFAGLTQILISLATFCSSLELLDVSGVLATSHPASIPLEKLQKGCPKLRVFRAANSQLVLGTAATIEQMESPGFACLEELSVACPSSDYKFIDDDALGRILKTSTALRLLDVRGCLRISDSGLVRVPAWDLQHLFLSGCSVTRQKSSCLELIMEKWSHSLLEVDLQWGTATRPLDSAIEALADKGDQSQLRILNLCGSAVSLEPVKKVLLRCPKLESINLSSCRGFPRGMKRLYSGVELQDLKDSIDPVKIKEKEEQRLMKDKKRKSQEEAEEKIKKDSAQEEANIKQEHIVNEIIPKKENEAEAATKESTETEDNKVVLKSPYVFIEDVNIDEKPDIKSEITDTDKAQSNLVTSAPDQTDFSPEFKEENPKSNQSSIHPEASPTLTPKNWNLDQFSPAGLGAADSSVQIKPEMSRASGWHSKQFSPVTKPDSQQIPQTSPEAVKQDPTKASSSWNLGQFNQIKQDSQYRQVSPDTRQQSTQENQKPMGNWNLEQFSPAPQKGSPENIKKDPQKAGSWNVGQYSPMTRQDGQYASQQSPYSAQPSPAQPSPYSAQPSPYSAQPSPYSAQPSPDTSQAVKQDAPKSTWNLGQFSPMAKQVSQYSSQPSPDTGVASKEKIGTSWNLGQFSPMTRQDGQFASQQSPYSPRPSPEAMKQEAQKPISSRKSKSEQFSSQRSPGMGKFSPMVRPDCSIPNQPNPDTGQISRNNRAWSLGQFSPMPAPVTMPSPDTSSGKVNAGWSLGPFSPVAGSDMTQNVVPKPNQMWNVGHFNVVPPKSDSCPSIGQSVPEGHHFETKSNQGQWNYNQQYDVLADLQQHMDTGQTMSKSMNSWNLGQFNLGQASSSVHPDFQMSSSVNAQCAWSDNSGYMNNPLIPTTVQGMCAKSDKDRTAYGAMDAVNPVTTSCAVSQISSMLQAPMEPLNGPSRID